MGKILALENSKRWPETQLRETNEGFWNSYSETYAISAKFWAIFRFDQYNPDHIHNVKPRQFYFRNRIFKRGENDLIVKFKSNFKTEAREVFSIFGRNRWKWKQYN